MRLQRLWERVLLLGCLVLLSEACGLEAILRATGPLPPAHVSTRRHGAVHRAGQTHREGGGGALAPPLRILVDTSTLASDVRTCGPGSENAVVTIGNGARGACGDTVITDCTTFCRAEDIVDDARAALIAAAAGEVTAQLSRALSARAPLSAPLALDTTECGLAALGAVKVPTRYGAAGTAPAGQDIVLFVTARRTFGSISAYAVACEKTAAGRVIAAHVNLNPSSVPAAGRADAIRWTRIVQTILHESVHALGFDTDGLAALRNADGSAGPKTATTITSVAARRAASFLVSPAVRAAVRAHFACPTAFGAELEDGGGDGTALLHLEKRMFGPELMTGSLGNDRAVLSPVTLGVLEDTGHYYQAHPEAAAEPYRWLHAAGCSVLGGECPFGIRTCPGGALPSSGAVQQQQQQRRQRSSAAVRGLPLLGGGIGGAAAHDLGAQAGDVFARRTSMLSASSSLVAAGYICTDSNRVAGCTQRGELGEEVLAEWSGPVPTPFQYFTQPNLAGDDALADYCPRLTPYSATGNCTGRALSATEQAEGQDASGRASCFVAALTPAGAPGSGVARLACLWRACVVKVNATAVDIVFAVGGQYHTCPRTGGALDIGTGRAVHCPVPREHCLPGDIGYGWIDPVPGAPTGAAAGTFVGNNTLARPAFGSGSGAALSGAAPSLAHPILLAAAAIAACLLSSLHNL
jgi:hypothetical protein